MGAIGARLASWVRQHPRLVLCGLLGAGALLYSDSFPDAREPEHPDARWLAQVVTDERVELLDPEPMYLRRPDAATPGKRKKVS